MIEENNYIQYKTLNNECVTNLYTKKPFNFNGAKVDKDKLKSQYEEIKEIIGYDDNKIRFIKPFQTHTNVVKKVEKDNLEDKFENVDGLITNLRGVALVTSLADCQGILLYDKTKQVIGNIHSGWKGTLNRIICNGINIMINDYNCNVEDIEVYICPSILKCCFEVDEDIMKQFLVEFKDINIEKFIYKGQTKNSKQKYFIDTISINIEVLKNIGILSENIYNSNICTKCNNYKFHSHRGDIEDGRNIALIMLK